MSVAIDTKELQNIETNSKELENNEYHFHFHFHLPKLKAKVFNEELSNIITKLLSKKNINQIEEEKETE